MRRVVIISDLHIGGVEQPMLGHPEVLTAFLERLASDPHQDEIELVVAGDFIDFLAESPYAPWTTTEEEARNKLRSVFGRNEALFTAFARCACSLGRLTILLGNHDIELAYPRVRDDLFSRLQTGPHRCHLVQSNEAYRVGELLIEHGNRYDSWNAIDHDGLRQIASCASRGEAPPRPLDVCPGSWLVHGAMNPLKERYHFIDLLKPEGEILGLLLLEFEPSLVRRSLPQLRRLASAWVAERYRRAKWYVHGDGVSPGSERMVSSTESDVDSLPTDIRRAFFRELNEMESQQGTDVSAGNKMSMLQKMVLGREEDGLRAMFARNESIPTSRLRKLQVALRGVLAEDKTFEEGIPDGNCHAAAKKMIGAGVAKVVVMGHTHMARDIPLAEGRYMNTGTWADLIRIDAGLLVDTDEAREAFTEWLRRLVEDRLEGIREHLPRFAYVEVDDAGDVGSALLPKYSTGEPFPWD